MRHKVKWLMFWISMVLWFGNMWGCATPGNEQNYKASQPDRPSNIERYDSRRTVPVEADGTVYVADEAAPAAPAPADAAPAPAPIAEAASLKGLDRSHWPKIKAAPETGYTRHLPTYFADYPADRDEPQINFNDPQEVQLEAALSGNKDHGLFDGHHALQLLSQPAKFGMDMILLPFRMVVTPPWKEVTTP